MLIRVDCVTLVMPKMQVLKLLSIFEVDMPQLREGCSTSTLGAASRLLGTRPQKKLSVEAPN